MTVVSTAADIAEAARRIDAGSAALGLTNPPLNPDVLANCIETGDIVIIVDADDVIWAHFDPTVDPVFNPTPAWWGVAIYGSATFWRTLAKELALALIARGQGDVPVRWTKTGAAAAMLKTAFKFKNDAKPYWEFTANKGLALLP